MDRLGTPEELVLEIVRKVRGRYLNELQEQRRLSGSDSQQSSLSSRPNARAYI